MNIRNISLATLAVLAVAATAQVAHAQNTSTTFAQFTQLSPSAKPFVFTPNANGGTFQATAVPVLFTIGGLGDVPVTTYADAQLNLFANLTPGASSSTFSYNANLSSLTASFTAVRNGQTINLLTVSGLPGSSAGQFGADGTSGNIYGSALAGNGLVFESDVFNIDPAQEVNYSLGFVGINPTIANSTPAAFAANGTGTFAGNLLGSGTGVGGSGSAAAPEPGTVALIGIAGVPFLGLVRRRMLRK